MTDNEKTLREWLGWLRDAHKRNGIPKGWHYGGPADLLLREAKFYEPGEVVDWSESEPNACFRNAAMYAMLHKVRYVEGYAIASSPCITAGVWMLTAR